MIGACGLNLADDILEVGAGMGRFTLQLKAKGLGVVAADFDGVKVDLYSAGAVRYSTRPSASNPAMRSPTARSTACSSAS